MMQEFLNADCMEVMKQYTDQFFDLAIVDPPYGNGNAEYDAKSQRYGARFTRYIERTGGGTWGKKYVDRRGGQLADKYGKNILEWDEAPPQEYFDELFRVSKNQIIWGGNYFNLPPTRCFIVWRKATISENFSMAMAEYAWASFNENARVYETNPQGRADDPRFHPTQKPVELYEWLLNHYAKKGDKILDTHAGSASSVIAFLRGGYEYVATEINEDYYKRACERIERMTAQQTIFNTFGGDI